MKNETSSLFKDLLFLLAGWKWEKYHSTQSYFICFSLQIAACVNDIDSFYLKKKISLGVWRLWRVCKSLHHRIPPPKTSCFDATLIGSLSLFPLVAHAAGKSLPSKHFPYTRIAQAQLLFQVLIWPTVNPYVSRPVLKIASSFFSDIKRGQISKCAT